MAALSCRGPVSHTLADQGTGEVEESRMVGHLALPAHQYPTAAVEPSVCPLNHPSARPLTFPLIHFLSPTANMNPIAAPRCLVPRARIIIAQVETQMLHHGCAGAEPPSCRASRPGAGGHCDWPARPRGLTAGPYRRPAGSASRPACRGRPFAV